MAKWRRTRSWASTARESPSGPGRHGAGGGGGIKRKGDFFDKIADVDNLESAFGKAAAGKHDREEVRAVEAGLPENLEGLHCTLEDGEFHTSRYWQKTIYEPKRRVIYVLPFWPDRVVQHAVVNVLEPYWQAMFSRHSYSCMKGRGQHRCSERVMRLVKRYKYVYKADIRHFYPSLDHAVLKGIYRRKIKDPRTLALLDDIVDSAGGGKNVPIGNLTSQWFGNLYMNEMDAFVEQGLGCGAYARFCDDFVLFGDDKAELRKWKEEVEKFAETRLLLGFSESEIFQTKQGVDFLGYRHFPEGYVLLRKSTAKRTRRDMDRLRAAMRDGTLPPGGAAGRAESANGWASWADSHNYAESIGLPELRREARMADGIKSYAEIVYEKNVARDGTKMSIESILDRPITITGLCLRPSHMHRDDYLRISFTLDGEKHVAFTDSKVLKRQCADVEDCLPFTATVRKEKQYYKLT